MTGNLDNSPVAKPQQLTYTRKNYKKGQKGLLTNKKEDTGVIAQQEGSKVIPPEEY